MTADESTLASELRRDGVDVEEVAVSPDGVVDVTYTTTLPGREPDHMELGRVCNTFIDLHEGGEWEPARVEATSLRAPGDVQATWHVEPEWLEGLASYRLTEEEFSARVLESVEVDPGDVAADDGSGTDDADPSDDGRSPDGGAVEAAGGDA